MDYLAIGSNGFAQVGCTDFYEKNKVEMKALMEYLEDSFLIPEEFWNICQVWCKEYFLMTNKIAEFE